jgi:uncharacterized membrane protein YfcA
MRSFFTTPSQARTQLALAVHFVVAIGISLLVISGHVSWGLVWAAGISAVLSIASGVLVFRRLPPDRRRMARAVFITGLVGMAFSAALVAAAVTLTQ